MVAIGVLDEAEPEDVVSVAEPVEPVVSVVPEAPMDVPLPVVEPVAEPMPVVEPAVVSVLPVLGVVPIEPEPVALPVVEELVSVDDGVVLEVDGVVVVVEDDELAASSFLPQALRDRAAIRARAAHCAIGDLIIRNSLRVVVFRVE